MLKVIEIFKSIQGEGECSGTPSIFVRFSGCNLNCPFCDTDHITGAISMTVQEILNNIYGLLKGNYLLIVLTGGEPLKQDPTALKRLVEALLNNGLEVQLETNGTIASKITEKCTYVTCSPKKDLSSLNVDLSTVTCWKILFPSPFSLSLEFLENLTRRQHKKNISFYLQPLEDSGINSLVSKQYQRMTFHKILELGHPWKLSLQTHKFIEVP